MSDNINFKNVNLFTNGLISGKELEQVSREIFTAAPTSTESSSNIRLNQDFSKINLDRINKNNGLKVVGTESNLDIQTVRQIASNKAGLDIKLSEQTVLALEALKIQAAKTQIANFPQKMDGKIHIPSEVVNPSEIKSIFSSSNKIQVFVADSLDKDKKGAINTKGLLTKKG
ncbi:MAG: hypothetical protein V2B14_03775 [bacterium]